MKTPHARTAIPTTDGLQLSALLEGRAGAPMLVFVHGYPDNLRVWDAVVSALQTRYRIVRYDVRGAGRSDAPDTLGGYRLPQLSADFRRVINHFSPDEPVHLIGHDWGSIQSWEFATDPALAGRIASFTSISGPGLDQVAVAARAPRAGMQRVKEMAASWYIGAFHLPALGPLTWKLGLARHWHRVLARLEKLPDAPQHGSQARDGINGINLYRANVLPRLLRPRPRQATAPVQLVVATRDPFVKPYMLKDLGRWAPSLQRAEIDAGHWLPLTQPNWLATQIDRFVQSLATHNRSAA